MPISKYLIRNEFGLADPELYRAADKDDPEALLEAVAMAGLVGLLRQLGDLAEFAAEMFHDLHEEVMATTARGHSLTARVKQLEAEVPSLEKAFFSQTHHSSFFTNGGIDWHSNLQSEQNLITRGNLPRLIMDSYEECRGPPRLFLLDKFDVAGAGACLKRYTDPSFFKMESASSVTTTGGVHREKRIRKVKQKKGARLRDGEAPNVVPTHSKLHQLLLEERIENGYSNPARLVKLKKRQLNAPTVEAKAGKSYMEKFLETPSPDSKMICETSMFQLPVRPTLEDTSEAGIKILEISSISPVKKSVGNENTCSMPNEQELELEPLPEVVGETNGDLVKVKEQISVGVTDEMSFNVFRVSDETDSAINEQRNLESSLDGYHSDDVTSEVDNYVDALTTMESELETDNEYKPKKSFSSIQKLNDNKEDHQLQTRLSDSHSFGDSSTSDEISSFKQERNEEQIESKARLSDSPSTVTSSTSNNNSSFREDEDEHGELQAHLPASKSIGNSSSSDDSSSSKKDASSLPHSDWLSTVIGNRQSKPMSVRTTKSYQPEIELTPSNQIPKFFDVKKTDSGKFVTHDDAHVHEQEISDSRQVPSDMLTSGQLLCSDLEPATPVAVSAGTESAETLSDTVEPNIRLGDDAYDADITGLVESVASEPLAPSLIKNDACPVDCSAKISLDKLVHNDPYIHPDHVLQISNDLELADGDECIDQSEVKIFQAESPRENSSEILVCQDLGSKEEDSICPTIDELDLYSGLDCQGSKDENMPNMVHGDDITESTCSADPVEVDVHFNDPSFDNHDSVNGMVPEIVKSKDQPLYSVPSVESAENDVGIITCPASGLVCSPLKSLSNMQEAISASLGSYQKKMESNDVELTQTSTDSNTEKSEHQLAPSLDTTSSDIIYSPMSNLTKLEESLSAFANPDEREVEVHEAVARESLTELAGQKIVGDPEIVSAEVEMNLNKLVPCDLSDLENIQKSSPNDKFQPSAILDDAKMVPEFSELDARQSESMIYGQNDHLQNSRESSSSPSCNRLECETDLEPHLRSQVDEQDAEFLLKDKENLASEKSQSQQMQICQSVQEGAHATNVSVSEIPADEPSSFYAMDPLMPFLPDFFPKATENNLDEMPPMPPLPPMQWRTGKVQHAFLDSPREGLEVSRASVQPMQPVLPDMKTQFGLPVSDGGALLYQNPFLPVMAAGSDKLQHPSGFSLGVSGHPVTMPFQCPIMANESKGQYNYIVLDRNQIQNPFLTLPVVSTGFHPHGYIAASEGEMAQTSNPYAPILPTAHAVSAHDSISTQEEPYQLLSQLITETNADDKTLEEPMCSVVFRDGPPSSHVITSEGGMVHNSTQFSSIPAAECADSGHDSISQEEPTQSRSQFMTEASSDDKTLEASSDDKTLSQLMSDVESLDRPLNGHTVTSEGEMVQSSKPCFTTPSAESAVSGHDYISPQEKLTQPPGQLTTETSSEVKTPNQSISNVEGEQEPSCQLTTETSSEAKTPNQSVSNVEGEQEPPCQLTTETSSEVKTPNQSVSNVEGEQERLFISLMLPPNMESMEPNQSTLPFGGETSDFEGERINGKPKNKLPRPRNPLIDAVAAHDKSKLRRVTERVMPEIAQKVDERDSLLEQIRTKSFNLKPAVATRPRMQGPRTNMKLAAILEKANAIRQALAGSDEDDDADSWSDS